MRKHKNSNTNRGVALVLILGVLVLILVLAIGFLGRASSERGAAASYEAGMEARVLATTAVGVVQAQIDQASRAGVGMAWISQPGMVRVFNTAGTQTYVAKLYSASTLTAPAAPAATFLSALAGDLPSGSWRTQPAEWVDLNLPTLSGNSTVFPIIDPRAAEASGRLAPVEGFNVTPLAGASGTLAAAEMPVRWLYSLRNGELVSPTSVAGNRLEFDPAVVTDANPIVGRIAFWTDDETCKVNVNTAGEGTFWDVPRTMSIQDSELGDKQPALGEYVRYAGHPATTSLSAVFPGLSPAQILDNDLTPRYTWGGSQAGTAVATASIPPRSDRLYSSISELLFKPDRSEGFLTTGEIEERGFFLTAHSRAPETNLFNLPRMAIWPLHVTDADTHRTPFDRQVAAASSINNRPYFLQRELAQSPTHDLSNIPRNLELYNYIRTLGSTTVPGFGGTFATKYGTNWNQIITQVFDYIRSSNLVDPLLEVAPSGVTFAPKANLALGGHSMTPGYGTAAPIRHPTNNTMGFGRFYTLAEFSLHFICTADAGDGSDPQGVMQSNIPPNAGGGPANRNLTLDAGTPLLPGERRIMAAVHLRLFSPAQGWVTMQPRMQIEVTGLEQFRLAGQQLFPASANGRIDIGRYGPDAGHLGSAYGGNAGTHTPLFGKRAPARGNLPADPAGARAEDLYPFISNPVTIPAGTNMSFTGGPVIVRIYSGNAVDGSAPELVQTINLTVPNGTFPRPTLALQPPARWMRIPYEPEPGYAAQYYWTFGQSGAVPDVESRGRFYGVSNGGSMVAGESFYRGSSGSFFHENDVIRSMVVRHGDHRLNAARSVVPATEFVAHPLWNSQSDQFAIHLYNDRPSIYWPPGYNSGSLLNPSTAAQMRYRHDIPSTRTNADAPIVTRDFDNGTAWAMDGPYINKPDEGNTYRGASTPPYMYGGNLVGEAGSTFFSPNRQIPSPGVFGSLPSQLTTGQPWRTLLFRPQDNHPASTVAPKDHLLMDLFWMPVVEPYAISEPFSTAGKINLNQQIVPFSHIERLTGLVALLKSEKITAIPFDQVNSYKYKDGLVGSEYRIPIDIPATLLHWKARLISGGAYKSASEVCDLFVIPLTSPPQSINAATGAWANANNFWLNHRLTGDNARERIYTTLYPRLTTRSNTFTVHYWTQALKQAPGQPANVWEESRGSITGSHRGHTTIERFIDPNNPLIPDYPSQAANLNGLPALDTFFRWRTVSNVQFPP